MPKTHHITIELTVETTDCVSTTEVVCELWKDKYFPNIPIHENEIWLVNKELVKERSHHAH